MSKGKIYITVGWWISDFGHWIASLGGRLRTKGLTAMRKAGNIKTSAFEE